MEKFRKSELLFEQDDGKFKDEYLKKWKGTSKNRSQFLWRRNLEGGVILKL